jgi:hypothetical protein
MHNRPPSEAARPSVETAAGANITPIRRGHITQVSTFFRGSEPDGAILRSFLGEKKAAKDKLGSVQRLRDKTELGGQYGQSGESDDEAGNYRRGAENGADDEQKKTDDNE